MTVNTIIVDDEPLARERLRDLLLDEPDFAVVGEASNGAEALKLIDDLEPELVFLDIQMPGLDGIRVVESVSPDLRTHFVFVTAFDMYALKAFEVHALDYLLKPFDRMRFKSMLEEVRSHIQYGKDFDFQLNLKSLLEKMWIKNSFSERFVVKNNGKILFLKTADINWIESAGNYAILHSGKENHIIRETLSALEERLDPDCFFRINRSTIIHIDFVSEILTSAGSEYIIVLNDGQRLTLSRKYKEKTGLFQI